MSNLSSYTKPLGHVGSLAMGTAGLIESIKGILSRNEKKKEYAQELATMREEQSRREIEAQRQRDEFVNLMNDKDAELDKLKQLIVVSKEENEVKRREMMEQIERNKNEQLTAQKEQYDAQVKQREQGERQRVAKIQAEMEQKLAQQENAMKSKLDALTAEQVAERKQIMDQFNEEKDMLDLKLKQMQLEMIQAQEKHASERDEMMKIIEKKNYESHYPMPEELAKIYAKYPDCFAIQILG